MPSPEPAREKPRLETLLPVARASIGHGIDRGAPLSVDPAEHGPALAAPRATFVTLRRDGLLRGCIGSLEAVRPLVVDVAHNAFGAAFRDPRFRPVAPQELAALRIQVSVLAPPEPIRFASEADLLRQLRPGVDGLVLRAGARRGTFLPQVWEQLPEAEAFWRELKRKAGLPPGHGCGTLEVSRYTVECIAEAEDGGVLRGAEA
jgi:AmmeMemoRadiSam system protein A